MAKSIPQLHNEIREKERELESLDNHIKGAGIGALIAKNPLVGAAVGAYAGREKAEMARLQKEIAQLQQNVRDTERQIAQLKEKSSQLQNTYQSDAARRKSDTQQKRKDLERLMYSEQDPGKHRVLDEQIDRLERDADADEQRKHQELEASLRALQDEVNGLSL